ncbi:MAG: hypothetical protein Q4F24_13730 [Eubacteriales bacterium]|nr:hypothetical protein [Eubacteriales bacterium]
MSSYKQYVAVTAEFTVSGELNPLWITWDDGRKFSIDRIVDCRRAASLKAGGVGLRFTCFMYGAEHYLFYEGDNLWFVELKTA